MIFCKKAILMVCLFLLLSNAAHAQEFSFSEKTRAIYTAVLDLQFNKAKDLKNTNSSEAFYVQSMAETFDLLLTEDAGKFSEYEDRFEARLDKREKKTPTDLFVTAEMHLQWAFVDLKYGHELDAAMHFRKAYVIAKEVRKKYPEYRAILKTSGLLNVMIGSIPDKYNWILDLLDMHGDVDVGLAELNELLKTDHPLSFEALLLKSFIYGYILQDPQTALIELEPMFSKKPNGITLFAAVNLHMKNSNGEKALEYIGEIERRHYPIPYSNYLKGELLLYKGKYSQSIQAFQEFLSNYNGHNFVKDAHFKIGICHLLNGNEAEARNKFQVAKNVGKEETEADKYASRALSENQLPSVPLLRARYFTDGGYYEEAKAILESVNENMFSGIKEAIELPYRKARLYHKMNDLPNAVSFYKRTIELSGETEFYFAPNACLQLGYIMMDENNPEEARKYFSKALSYRKHEYKNSIDSKARSALAHLSERR